MKNEGIAKRLVGRKSGELDIPGAGKALTALVANFKQGESSKNQAIFDSGICQCFWWKKEFMRYFPSNELEILDDENFIIHLLNATSPNSRKDEGKAFSQDMLFEVATDKAKSGERLIQWSIENEVCLTDFCEAKQKDRDFVIPFVKDGYIHTAVHFHNDKDMIVIATKAHPNALSHCNKELKADREFVRELYKISHWSLQAAAPELRRDEAFMLELAHIDPAGLHWAMPDLWKKYGFPRATKGNIQALLSAMMASKL